ncbi:Gfo/Idh/MocA family protein [Streptomyces sp. VRA16 Mangrove soil]|uniref:Gfo/Idh/MocA family protein n=1 Tax=Streptomyces sp. VRA16 Mangrove soil TaxID=2817434 RepID=UPI001A9DD3B1|nr:Gfo/Idh/MocA family oxidoreductase [Streptomyces sp. VRA16 Mangrove soil]MBO1332170.1 Gfo/Idh/MocA family oxidoreductase [Streptomyces sp. VRA16 Mangrove soil]
MKTIKVGVLSFAHVHAGGFARGLAGLDGVEVLTADPDTGPGVPGELRGKEFAARIGVNYVDTYEELFAWGPDKVVVCAENVRHRPLVELAASHGVDVLCEKPLATTPEDGAAMVEACRAAGVRLAVAHPVRFSPAYLAVREAVRAGTAGEVLTVSAANNGYMPGARRRWFVDPALAGGGALTDHTVHVVDLLDDLFEASPVTSVYAQTNNLLYEAAGDVPVETAGLLTLTYANGAVLTLDCSWSQPRHHPAWGGLSMQVVGERAILEMDAFDQKVFGFDETARRPVELPYGVDLDGLMLRAFLFGPGEGPVDVTDGAAGLRALRIVAAAYESARTGRAVPVG